MCSCGVESPSHNSQQVLHTKHRQTAVLCQPGKMFKTLGYSRRVMGSQVYPRKPKPAPPLKVIMETLLFCNGNQLQSTWTQLWLQWGRHLWPTLGPRCDMQPLSAKVPSRDHPCVGTTVEGAMGITPSGPCVAGAK